MRILRFLFTVALLTLPFGCDDSDSNVVADASGDGDVQATACPPKDGQAPLNEVCPNEGQVCSFGYEPIECGGMDLQCTDGYWADLIHTDPTSACFADVSDADVSSDVEANAEVVETVDLTEP